MLFIENSYLKEFESNILNIENNNIILEETAFYAKSGGQSGDTGKIIFNDLPIAEINSLFLPLTTNFIIGLISFI